MRETGFGRAQEVTLGTPLKCRPEAAMASPRACIAGFEAIDVEQRVVLAKA